MKTLKIPKGWHRIPRRTVIKTGDKFRCKEFSKWILTVNSGARVGCWWLKNFTYIRRKIKKS